MGNEVAYIHAVLALHAAGKEINELNIKKVLEALGTEVDQTKLRVLLSLLESLTQKTSIEQKNTSQFKSLEKRIESLEKSIIAINDKLVAFEKLKATKAVETGAQIEEAGDEVLTFISETTPAGVVSDDNGRYIYCVADSGEKIDLGDIGIENNDVYTIPYNDICAVVHNCPTEPYKSDDDNMVKGWIMGHEKVMETVWEKFGTILPLGFDVIIKPDNSHDSNKTVVKWLKEDYESLKQQMKMVTGKAEYGVQILWDPKVTAQDITESNEKIRKLNEEIKEKSKGAAYMHRQKIENELGKEMEKKADEYFKEFYGMIKGRVEKIRVEKTKKDKEMQMLMNLSCLLSKDKVEKLGAKLEKINKMDGFSVRFTGPWPPYSFISPG